MLNIISAVEELLVGQCVSPPPRFIPANGSVHVAGVHLPKHQRWGETERALIYEMRLFDYIL